jgi:hypothetical protein
MGVAAGQIAGIAAMHCATALRRLHGINVTDIRQNPSIDVGWFYNGGCCCKVGW